MPLLRRLSTAPRLPWLLLGLGLGCDPSQPAPATVEPSGPAQVAPEVSDGEERELGNDGAPSPPSAATAPSPNGRPGEGEHASDRALEETAKKLEGWAAERKGHARLALFDLESRAWRLEFGADVPENPASTQKLLTAAAALELLGPAYTFRTELLGRVEQGRVAKLVLRGGGAPDLETHDLWRFVHALSSAGVKEVEQIVVDQSRFEERWVPPAFEQQPNEWAAFRAPISAAAVDRNAVTLHVLPTKAGEAARVWFDPPGALTQRGNVGTGPTGSGDHVTWSVSGGAALLGSEVGGSLAQDAAQVRYSRRLDDPRRVPGLALAELLRERGITVAKDVTLGSGAGVPRFTYLDSQPLGLLVRALGKDSDNFSAEMLAVALSQVDQRGKEARATGAEPWSTARGLAVLGRFLEERGLGGPGLVLTNGSGLFDANRVSAHVLVKVLDYMAGRPASAAEFTSQLAQAGQDGTLRARFVRGPLAGRVRAKTGTLKDTSALAGYVLRADGRRPLAFAVIVSGAAGRQDEARKRIDVTLEELVARLGP